RQDPRDEDTDERLNRRAKTLASLAVSHELAGWRLGMDWRYTGERPDAAQAQTLSDYSVVDLTVRRSIGRRWSVFGRIEN
ncbi:TonB-dependent receptor, partial [Pseudomonas sp. GW460-13]|uniref:TonB-dependent receptor domain-containing protein n=1 Tax=Pseudomonas sp. GW460-13 TaxID=2070590 RepID=UPI000CAFAB92